MKSARPIQHRTRRARAPLRGVALIASRSDAFVRIAGDMLADAGFTPAVAALDEDPSRLLARTRPDLVMWDVSGGDAKLRPLMADAVLSHLPMLLVWTPGEEDVYTRNIVLPARVAWITFPILRDVFRATIDRLLASALPFVNRVNVGGRGIALDAGVALRCLDDILGSAADADAVTLAPPSTAEYRSMRLLP